MKHTLLISLILILFKCTVFASVLADISGKVTDSKTNQPITGATISIPQLKLTANTNQNGEFTFKSTPQRGKFIVEVSYVGYGSVTRVVDFSETTPLIFSLQESVVEMKEVVVTGTAVSSNNKQNSTSVSTLSREQLLAPSSNIIDQLAKQVPGVSQITTGPSISKPIIRGLGYNRVVTLNDGIKQQGQQWGDEHGVEIDQYGVERVEVLRGAASLLYGSDALGGVINMLEPLTAPEGQIRGELLSNYSTNNGMSANSMMLTGNESGFVWRTRASYKNAYSFKTPAGYFPNSGFNETNLNGMVGLNKHWGYSHLSMSYFKNNIGFYEPAVNLAGQFVDENGDAFSEDQFKSRSLEYPRQDIRHYKIGLDNNFILSKGYIKVNLGFQKNQRRELDGPDPSLFFDLNTYSTDIKYYATEKNNWQTVYGMSMDGARSQNRGEEFLVPAYNTLGAGLFGYFKKTWERSTFNFGLRYDYRQNKSKQLFDGSLLKFAAFTNSFSNVSGALGYTYQFNDKLNFKANAGSAFRAPNPAELGSNGVHEGTYRYEIGNSKLDPERSYQADATLEFGGEVINGSFGIYNNYIRNFIYASNTGGENINVANDDGTISNYDVYRYEQVNANLYGAEATLTLHPVSFIHFDNSFGFTHAQNTTLNRPLSFIPAASLRNTLRFEPKIKGTRDAYLSLGLENFFKQDRIDATFETSTAGYTLLNAGIGTTLLMGKQPLKLSVSASNLTDLKYYDALSRLRPGRLDQSNPTFGVYNTGRNITFGVYLPFVLKASN
jgi:iron complex outermembrane receptor protein